MQFGDVRPIFGEIIRLLKSIDRHGDGCCLVGTSAGLDSNIPAGFSSISLVLLSGSINVAMSDGTSYPMSTVGEILTQSASPVGSLPSYIITGTGTWKWIATK